MKLKTAFFIWIFSVINNFGFSQCLNQTIEKADSLMTSKSFAQAEILYERALFFADSANMLGVINKTALCKVALYQYSEAADLYGMANNYEFVDSSFYLNLLKQALCLILNNQLIDAQTTIKEIEKLNAPIYFLRKASFLNAIIETQNLNFALARIYFDSSINLFYEQDKIDLLSLIRTNTKKCNINITKSAIYSAIIPGLGQAINGNFKSGVNSFLLNGTFLLAIIYTGVQYNFITSFAFYSFFFPRYYLGGINESKLIANNKLSAIKKEYLNKYLTFYLKY